VRELEEALWFCPGGKAAAAACGDATASLSHPMDADNGMPHRAQALTPLPYICSGLSSPFTGDGGLSILNDPAWRYHVGSI